MDEFFFDQHEHLALAEPMVVECARSAPVRERKPECIVARPYFVPRTYIVTLAHRWFVPQPVAPPELAFS